MKKNLKITLLVIIYLLVFSAGVQAYTADFSGTPASVESGETFTVKITVDEATTLANSHIEYDSSLFTFVEATQTNLSASIYESEGEVSWMYTDLNTNSEGVKTFEFTFKANKVTEDKTGTFKMSDVVFITVGEKTYEGTNVKGNKSIDVTVKATSDTTADEDKTPSSSLSSKDTTSTSGSKTNATSTTTYNNATNKITSDRTTTEEEELPKTGESITKAVILIAVLVFSIRAFNTRIKGKNLF